MTKGQTKGQKQPEVYVRSFPDMGPVTKISVDGGSEPRWHPGGNAIFYRTATDLVSKEPKQSSTCRRNTSEAGASTIRCRRSARMWGGPPTS